MLPRRHAKDTIKESVHAVELVYFSAPVLEDVGILSCNEQIEKVPNTARSCILKVVHPGSKGDAPKPRKHQSG